MKDSTIRSTLGCIEFDLACSFSGTTVITSTQAVMSLLIIKEMGIGVHLCLTTQSSKGTVVKIAFTFVGPRRVLVRLNREIQQNNLPQLVSESETELAMSREARLLAAFKNRIGQFIPDLACNACAEFIMPFLHCIKFRLV